MTVVLAVAAQMRSGLPRDPGEARRASGGPRAYFVVAGLAAAAAAGFAPGFNVWM